MKQQRAIEILFAGTIFVGAFLLFQVQPIIGKYILPWFGGSPAVWTTCMLFFQCVLLLGYAYAHGLIRFVPQRGQGWIHLILLGGALLLPIVPGAEWIPPDESRPMSRILWMLLYSVGLPYFMLASTGPLLQAWFTRVAPDRSPYRLYALSNVASLLALVSYPFLVEPNLTRSAQATLWRCCLGGFAALCAVVAILSSRRAALDAVDHPGRESIQRASIADQFLWLALPAAASAMLLAVTNKICQDVAVIPLLWIVPLTLYLLSFIISFDSPRWYHRGVFMPLMAVSMAMACVALFQKDEGFGILGQIAIYCTLLFSISMVCHGELFRRRPDAARLTSYYLMISLGGAIGGALVAIGAPLLLKGYFELHIGIVAVGILTLIVLRPVMWRRDPSAFTALCIALITITTLLWINATRTLKDALVLDRKRDFYGVLTVYSMRTDDPLLQHRILQHGGVTHGVQFSNPARRTMPTAYYGYSSGVGVMFRNLPRAGPVKVGAIGLGVGTVAVYGEEGDIFRFYEINYDVRIVAYAWFAYLNGSRAKHSIQIGDARLSLQREEPQDFDVLILDAFSGDAVPVHLLTKECFDIYLRHLKPGGIIAIHISNQSLNLAPIVERAAERFGLKYAYIASPARVEYAEYDARWMLLTKNDAWINSAPIRSASSPVPLSSKSIRLWTDDDANLFQILD